jgi:protein-L-isoaspartate(D-aspartate) O-methyltransferase
MSLERQKETMLELHLKGRGITNRKILKAMIEVPREEFVPQKLRRFSYKDIPLLIGYGQTISQPFTVAYSLEALDPKGDQIVLDIGTGSGYQAALLGMLCKRVITIERIPELAERARHTIRMLGYNNIEVIVGNGILGYERYAPYDRIICAAATESLPIAWEEQIVDGGIIVFPKNAGVRQRLVRVTRNEDSFNEEILGDFSFVPLVNS